MIPICHSRNPLYSGKVACMFTANKIDNIFDILWSVVLNKFERFEKLKTGIIYSLMQHCRAYF